MSGTTADTANVPLTTTHGIRIMRTSILSLFLVCLAACGSTGSATEEGITPSTPEVEDQQISRESAPAWTPSFTRGALLIADELEIEGPRGLLQHLAARVVEPHHRQQVETLPEGFRHIIEVVDPSVGIEIRAHLDQMQMVAMRRITILERPGNVRVKVRALGQVFYKRDGAEPVERASLELQGADPR